MFSFGCFLAPLLSEGFLSTKEDSRQLLLGINEGTRQRKSTTTWNLQMFLGRQSLLFSDDAARTTSGGEEAAGLEQQQQQPQLHPKRLWLEESGIVVLYPLIGKAKHGKLEWQSGIAIAP